MTRLLFAACLLAIAGCATPRQPPLRPPGISRVEQVTLGGQPQTVFIRGRDTTKPVILFLHGGPGLPEMPFSHVNAELERDFIVVHWDQRGAGKSSRSEIPPDSMSIDRLVRDTEALTRQLCVRFGKEKIYLAGFSSGSLIGMLTVARAPQLFHAYVGISPLVSVPRSELLLHRAGIEEAERQGKERIARELRQIGEPPYPNRRTERRVNALTKSLQPAPAAPLNRPRVVTLVLSSPYYSIADVPRILRGMKCSGRTLEADLWSHDLRREVPRVAVPVHFFLSRHDTVLSAPLAANYFEMLSAPRGKRLVWFEHSAHAPHLEESARFREKLRQVAKPSQQAPSS